MIKLDIPSVESLTSEQIIIQPHHHITKSHPNQSHSLPKLIASPPLRWLDGSGQSQSFEEPTKIAAPRGILLPVQVFFSFPPRLDP